MEVPKKLKIELPNDLAIRFLGMYLEKTITGKDTCTPMFTAALFKTARTWKQSKCPSTEERIKNILFSSVAQSCPTLFDLMNRSTPGLPVHHKLPEFTQTHAHRVGDAIQPSHPLSPPSPPAPNPSQHQGLFK